MSTVRLLCLILACGTAFAQQKDAPARFDVASIRPDRSEANGSSIARTGGRLTLEHVSLRECVAFAYGVAVGQDYELIAPQWLGFEKFNIAATFPPETSRDRVRNMLRTMLAERFKLKTHYEQRTMNAYALVVARADPKMNPHRDAEEGAFIWSEGQLTARAISMNSLAERLSGPVFKIGRPVLDMTDLKGDFDFILKWAPDDATTDQTANPSIFTALQEQLGLRLEQRRLVFRILIVDDVQKTPTEN